MSDNRRKYNGTYAGERLNRVAFPLGGIGAGMICLEGTGALSHVSIRNNPDVFNEPCMFSALCIKLGGDTNVARVLEGPVPDWKVFGLPGSGKGNRGSNAGLPRFSSATFRARFPFATVRLQDASVPLQVEVTGWSPFIPGDADSSSLPICALEYHFENPTNRRIDVVYSFNAMNFMSTGSGGEAILAQPNGFVLWEPGHEERPWEEGAFSAIVDDNDSHVNCAWFRGAWFDPLSMAWKDIEGGKCFARPPATEGRPNPGASIFVPLEIPPGQKRTVTLMLSWYVPETNLRSMWRPSKDGLSSSGCGTGDSGAQEDGDESRPPAHRPWYSARFTGIDDVARHWRDNYGSLRRRSLQFSDCFYDTTLPPEVVEAVAANLTILKSPTVLRQADGRLWGWEGSGDDVGSCAGSCTHVWNYAQALPHLFPDLERSLRQTEFNESQDERGHQSFRSALPIGPSVHDRPAAADGQLGGVMKVYRDWRVSGDTHWLRELWPKVKTSLDYCIETWDPVHKGVLEEPHDNTYDIAFWGPDGMCSSIYLGALKAAQLMGKALDDEVPLYGTLFETGKRFVETELFNGEYFQQKIQWQGLKAKDPAELAAGSRYEYSPEATELLQSEGPKYQYGTGCLSDGVIGAWLAAVCGVGEILDAEKVGDHLRSVYSYNLKTDMSTHANPQRPGYAMGKEGGLLLCTWPEGNRPSLPFVYSDEVWTGIEYQVASHLMLAGMVEEGLRIVRTCRDRYDGRVRNPFNEYECGHWYARAMASYTLLQGLSGVRYDAVDKVLYIRPSLEGDFRSFLCTATGYGTAGLRNGEPFIEVREGSIEIKRIDYEPGPGSHRSPHRARG